MNYWLFVVPFVSALLGWLIHSLIIKMIFRPVRLGPFHFKGILPSKQDALAEGIGSYAATQVPLESLGDKIADPALLARITPEIESHIDKFLKEKLTAELPMISMFIGDKTIGKVKSALMNEIEELLPNLLRSYAANLTNDMDIKKLVAEKIAQIDPKSLETMALEKASGAISAFKWLGAGIGFLGGLLQLLLTALLA